MEISEAINRIFDVIDKYRSAVSEESPGGKKVTLTEKMGIAITSLGLAKVFSSLNQLKEDWQSRDEEKKEAWVQAFKTRFDIEDEELEEEIENLVEAVIMLEGVFTKLSSKSQPDPPTPKPQ